MKSKGTPHPQAICDKEAGKSHYHSRSTMIGGSWSSLYKCPSCGRETRQNTNWLGQRVVTCDGVRIRLVKGSLQLRVSDQQARNPGISTAEAVDRVAEILGHRPDGL